MKKIVMLGAFFTSMACANADMMMGGYGMPQQGGYGMPGMPQQGGYGMPQQQGMPQQGGSNPLTQEVKNSILQNVMNNPNLSPDVKGEAAFSVALRVGLNEAIICLTFGQNGQIFRLHTNPKNNGIVTDQAEIQNYNNMLMQAKNNGGSAAVQASIVSNGQPETFTFDVLAIDQNHLVAVRHK